MESFSGFGKLDGEGRPERWTDICSILQSMLLYCKPRGDGVVIPAAGRLGGGGGNHGANHKPLSCWEQQQDNTNKATTTTTITMTSAAIKNPKHDSPCESAHLLLRQVVWPRLVDSQLSQPVEHHGGEPPLTPISIFRAQPTKECLGRVGWRVRAAAQQRRPCSGRERRMAKRGTSC